jgi:hypothetical protein
LTNAAIMGFHENTPSFSPLLHPRKKNWNTWYLHNYFCFYSPPAHWYRTVYFDLYYLQRKRKHSIFSSRQMWMCEFWYLCPEYPISGVFNFINKLFCQL